MDKRRKGGKKNAKKSTLSDEIVRQLCDCEATKHSLVNNCINCGRIVCLSEGPGPCFFCGFNVTYDNEPIVAPNFTKNSDNKNKSIYNSKSNSNLESNETLKLRDRLLEFDKDCASRTSVIDDECDYFQANNTWLTKSQREQWQKLETKIQEEKHKSRFQQKLSVDFTGRVHVEQEDPLELLKQMNSIQDNRNFDFKSSGNQYQSFKGPVYMSDVTLPSNISENDNVDHISNRIQDKGYLEISDQGVCLSMHQPYASLLVRGIKTTEGRTWYTSHRGRLWIASTVRQPKKEEIEALENMYRLTGTDDSQFPKSYPTGCLLGCVTVTDVLPQEEYEKLYADKTDSPYLFICENFFELPIKYPIQGKHKIYKLESVIHRAAVTCLEKLFLQMSNAEHST